ncbi:MAG: hypothetical protein R6W78_10835 [Bacteroidales bacterium]
MKKIPIIYFILSGIFFTGLNAQEHKYKAIFVYNFTRYLNRPDASIADE